MTKTKRLHLALSRRRDLICAAVVACLFGAGVFAAQGGPAASRPAAPAKAPAKAERPVLPIQPPPPVEPVQLVEISREDAVTINAAIPFSTKPNPAAKPFTLRGDERSLDCMTAALYYEAATEGDDGQRAVAQVVINRLRHPAFPKTICGVIFQGSERDSGCQFTFTCDGSLDRPPVPSLWKHSRALARQALSGKVFKPVGYSTHYHTDWVVPYWSASLEKVAAVGTHLFFRWGNGWGEPWVFRGRHEGVEPNIPLLAGLSSAHQAITGDQDIQLAGGEALGEAELQKLAKKKGAKELKIVSKGGDAFVVVLDRAAASKYPALALAACGDKDFCKFMGWTDRDQAPRSFPVSDESQRHLSFSYLRNRSTGFEKMLWNCREFKGRDEKQCMKAI